MAEEITPQELISAAATALEPYPSVHAIWLEGSHASGRADAYSDIDLWADVDAGSEEEVFAALRQGLSILGSLELEHALDHPHPQLRQRFYCLAGTSPHLFLDVCLQQHGRGTRLPAHEPFRVLYDPGGIVQVEPQRNMSDTVSRRLDVLRAGWWRRVLVFKEVERGHFLEALGYYRSAVLGPLTELLRLYHCPEKHDYGLKHIQRDLPADVVRELEVLYSVVTPGEFPDAIARANVLFERVSRVLAQE